MFQSGGSMWPSAGGSGSGSGQQPHPTWPSGGASNPPSGGWPSPAPAGGSNPGGWPSPAPAGGSNPSSGGWPSPAPGGGSNPSSGGWPSPAPAGGSNPGGWPSPAPGGGSNPSSGGWPSPAPAGGSNPSSGGWPSPAPAGGYNPPSGGWPSPAPGGGSNPPSAGWPSAPSLPSQRSMRVPFKETLLNGVYDKLLITISGTIKGNADKFSVDLCKNRDIAFHFNPRFNENGRAVIVRNSFIQGKWGREERELQRFPFSRGQSFEMKILCTPSEYKVAINKAHLLSYSHRIRDLRSITGFNIYFDLDLTNVKMETLH